MLFKFALVWHSIGERYPQKRGSSLQRSTAWCSLRLLQKPHTMWKRSASSVDLNVVILSTFAYGWTVTYCDISNGCLYICMHWAIASYAMLARVRTVCHQTPQPQGIIAAIKDSARERILGGQTAERVGVQRKCKR